MSTLNSAAHVVQLALTPIFLLTGLASMLNVFTTRLGRVADRVERLVHDGASRESQLHQLRLRSRILDVAVLLAALSGGLTCGAALTLFVGAMKNADDGKLLFALFGSALVSLMLALAAFSAETVLSGRIVREQAQRGPQKQLLDQV